MKKEGEEVEVKISAVNFDFTPAHVDNYFNALSKNIPDAEDLKT